MGAHKTHENGVDGIRFTTQATNTKSICVISDFSHWKIQDSNYMSAISEVGLLSVFIANAKIVINISL